MTLHEIPPSEIQRVEFAMNWTPLSRQPWDRRIESAWQEATTRQSAKVDIGEEPYARGDGSWRIVSFSKRGSA